MPERPRLFASTTALLLACALAPGSDWPQFLGPHANGRSDEKHINKDWNHRPPKLLWKVPLRDGGFTGPAVSNGLVYLIDHEGSRDVVKALELKNGLEKWRYEYEETSQN